MNWSVAEVAAASIAALAAIIPLVLRWRRQRLASVNGKVDRLSYHDAEVLIWCESGADASDVLVNLKYRGRAAEIAPLKKPFRIARLRAGGPPAHISFLFLPEYAESVVAIVDYTDRTGRRTDEIEMTWDAWPSSWFFTQPVTQPSCKTA